MMNSFQKKTRHKLKNFSIFSELKFCLQSKFLQFNKKFNKQEKKPFQTLINNIRKIYRKPENL